MTIEFLDQSTQLGRRVLGIGEKVAVIDVEVDNRVLHVQAEVLDPDTVKVTEFNHWTIRGDEPISVISGEDINKHPFLHKLRWVKDN